MLWVNQICTTHGPDVQGTCHLRGESELCTTDFEYSRMWSLPQEPKGLRDMEKWQVMKQGSEVHTEQGAAFQRDGEKATWWRSSMSRGTQTRLLGSQGDACRRSKGAWCGGARPSGGGLEPKNWRSQETWAILKGVGVEPQVLMSQNKA